MAGASLRLDEYLVDCGFYPDVDAALRAVIAGDVCVDGAPARSAAMKIGATDEVKVAHQARFVSRGGEKLECAFSSFDLEVEGLSCLDCGASTGGFTDCLLQHGAAHVCAVDVGYGQFSWKLRCDERVTLFERTNIRELQSELCGAPFSCAVADISFAPLRAYLQSVLDLLEDDAILVVLVKPQFEVARGQVGDRGVVSEPSVHEQVLENAIAEFESEGVGVLDATFSPIKGPMGNIEFLLFGRRGAPSQSVDVCDIVRASHESLG